MKGMPPAVEECSLNHWTTSGAPHKDTGVLRELRPPPGRGGDDAEFNQLSPHSADLHPNSALELSTLALSRIGIYP